MIKPNIKALILPVSQMKNFEVGFDPQRNHMNKIDKGPQRDDKTKYQSSNPSSFRDEEF